MKKTIFTMLIMLNTLFAYCWESVGFTINDHDLVNNYKLPARGYSQFDINYYLRGNYFRTDTEFKKASHSFLLSLDPRYQNDYESETFKYSFQSKIYTQFDYNESENEETNSDYIGRMYRIIPNIQGECEYYLQNDIFFNAYLNVNYIYNEKNYSPDTQDGIDRFFHSTPFIGIGLGRIRDVSPVFRALRFNERVKSLNKGLNLSDNQIRVAADKFAHSSNYKNLYDRYEKYFWEEFTPILGNEFQNLSLSETLYLTEVMREYIKRFQGYEIVLGLDSALEYKTYSYSNDDKEELHLGPSIKFRYYDNINLKYQIGIFSKISYLKLLEDETSQESKVRISFSNEHYFDITDRIRWNTEISIDYDYIWYKDLAGYVLNSRLTSVMDYFIENNFSLYLQLKSYLTHIDSEIYENNAYSSSMHYNLKRDEMISLYFGGRYYFGKMF